MTTQAVIDILTHDRDFFRGASQDIRSLISSESLSPVPPTRIKRTWEEGVSAKKVFVDPMVFVTALCK